MKEKMEIERSTIPFKSLHGNKWITQYEDSPPLLSIGERVARYSMAHSGNTFIPEYNRMFKTLEDAYTILNNEYIMQKHVSDKD